MITRDTDLRQVYSVNDDNSSRLAQEIDRSIAGMRWQLGYGPTDTFEDVMDILAYKILCLEDRVEEMMRWKSEN